MLRTPIIRTDFVKTVKLHGVPKAVQIRNTEKLVLCPTEKKGKPRTGWIFDSHLHRARRLWAEPREDFGASLAMCTQSPPQKNMSTFPIPPPKDFATSDRLSNQNAQLSSEAASRPVFTLTDVELDSIKFLYDSQAAEVQASFDKWFTESTSDEYSCRDCGEVCWGRASAERHHYRARSVYKLPCLLCDLVFDKRSALYQHQLRWHNSLLSDRTLCEYCRVT